MSARWTVLASGSSGNASLLQCDVGAILIDVGIGPRQLGDRLRELGTSTAALRGIVLTHTHADHWREKTLVKLLAMNVPLYCHDAHRRELQLRCDGLQKWQFAGLVRPFSADRSFEPLPEVQVRPIAVRHDGGPTFGFRIECGRSLFTSGWAIGYAADLGSWDEGLVRRLLDVDVLALEFNHDVELQRTSGRAPWLISRVLGDEGHLSNEQGAQLLEECLRRSIPGRLRHVIQLHLSRQCNSPRLAMSAARDVLQAAAGEIELHTADQSLPTRTIALGRERTSQVA